MPLGSDSRVSRNSAYVVHRHSMPASIASAEMSSARWRLRMTRARSALAQGARVKPQLPMTTLVMPCQQDDVPSGSQNTWASMWVWPSTKPGQTTRPSASMTSRRLQDATDGGDAPLLHAHVGAIARQTGAIHHPAILDHEVKGHPTVLPVLKPGHRSPSKWAYGTPPRGILKGLDSGFDLPRRG